MERRRIAVDCDDVIANVNDSMREFINESYGFNHTANDYRVEGEYHRYWERIWGIPEGQSVDWFSRYISSGRMAHLMPVDGALETLEGLRARYSLVLVTARSSLEVGYTEQWLAQHAPKLFDEVAFMHQWRRDESHQVTKGDICRELGADYLIDDNYNHCAGAATLGAQAILFGEYGWNKQDELPPNVSRAKDWAAVRGFFE